MEFELAQALTTVIEKLVNGESETITDMSKAQTIRAGLTTVPFMPWHRAPVVRGPPRPPANFFLWHNVL